MISLIQMAYGSCVRRQGKSRAFARNQVLSRCRTLRNQSAEWSWCWVLALLREVMQTNRFRPLFRIRCIATPDREMTFGAATILSHFLFQSIAAVTRKKSTRKSPAGAEPANDRPKRKVEVAQTADGA